MSTAEATEDAVRCSAWARSVSLDPIGTVGSYDGYLLVETPLPWPRDVAQAPVLGPLQELVSARRYRLQALVPHSAEKPPANRTVALYSRMPGTDWFAGYRRHETETGSSLLEAVQALDGAAPSSSPGSRDPQITDVLVCTHGRRDICCGASGTDLALQLAAREAPPGVRYRRTSHTGGHRFAPTFLLLPEGTAWAYADVDMVEAILARSIPFADVADHYRGCAGLSSPQVQAVEREVLRREGWEILDKPRRGSETEEVSGEGRIVWLEVATSAGSTERWEAVVRPSRTLPVPDCMKPLDEAKKTETEWKVADLRRI